MQEEDEEEKCSICLCTFTDKALVDGCFHAFCFLCIFQWGNLTPLCPLCKTKFNSIIHHVNSPKEYTQTFIEPAKVAPKPSVSGRTLRYQGSLPDPRQGPVVFPFTDSHTIRRNVYARKLKALPTTSSPLDPQSVATSRPDKLLQFLEREFQALTNEEDVSMLVQFFQSLYVSGKDSRAIIQSLGEFVFDNAEIFLHEVENFLSSGLDLVSYDRVVRYDFTEDKRRSRSPRRRRSRSASPDRPQSCDTLPLLQAELASVQRQIALTKQRLLGLQKARRHRR